MNVMCKLAPAGLAQKLRIAHLARLLGKFTSFLVMVPYCNICYVSLGLANIQITP